MEWHYQLFVILVIGLVLFIGYGTYATAKLLKRWQPDQNLLLMPAENAVRFVLILFCVGLGYLSHLDPAQLGWHLGAVTRQIWVGIFTGLGMAYLFTYLTRLIVKNTGERFYSSSVIGYILPRSDEEFWWVLLALVPVVLLEELLFRSLLLGGLSPLAPSWVLLLVFGVVFGLLHSPQGRWGMVGTALGGMVFGVLFLWHQSLLAPLLAHYVANAVQIVLAMNTPQSG
ncbi:CPBP family intramembrane metalloprotease [bacterium]|nr:CPBP family intramembrane metalloprotease [bacterium]